MSFFLSISLSPSLSLSRALSPSPSFCFSLHVVYPLYIDVGNQLAGGNVPCGPTCRHSVSQRVWWHCLTSRPHSVTCGWRKQCRISSLTRAPPSWARCWATSRAMRLGAAVWSGWVRGVCCCSSRRADRIGSTWATRTPHSATPTELRSFTSGAGTRAGTRGSRACCCMRG